MPTSLDDWSVMTPIDPVPIEVPEALCANYARYFPETGRQWISDLPALAGRLLDQWDLDLEGPGMHGAVALVLPVRQQGTPAMLKLQPVDEETAGESRALRAWRGLGAVEVREHDDESGSLLLQRLDPSRCLDGVADDVAAAQVIATFLRHLNAVAAPEEVRNLTAIAQGMLAQVPAVRTNLVDPAEQTLIQAAAAQLADLIADPVPRCLLHWDLHYQNVLATVEPGAPDWRVIDPKPLAGDPGFELLPALWNRFEEIVATGDVAAGVLRRFDAMTEVMELDRQRARAWTLARVLQNTIWDVTGEAATHLDPPQRAIAEALLVHR